METGVKDLRIAFAVGEYFEASVVPVLTGVQEAGKALKELGARVEQVDLSWISDLAAANSRMTQADAAAFHQERLQQHPDWFGEDVRQRLEMGAALSVADYIRARQLQAEGRRRFELFFKEYDLLVLPTTPIPAPPIAGTAAVEAARQLTRFTSPFNLVGLPAISIPCGWVGGLPFGVQLVTRSWDEAGLLQCRLGY